jgi:hypothetical protein
VVPRAGNRAYHQAAGTAYRQVVSQRRPEEQRETAAFPLAGLRACVVVGMVACWAAYRQGPGACLAAGRVAYRVACWGLSVC